MRLDLAVARAFALSRRAAREAVRAGRIDVDGVTRDEPGREIPQDASLRYDPNRPEKRRVRSRLTVLYEDEDLLVADKPAGLLSVPTAEREKDTLLHRALSYLQHRYRRRPYLGVVHRLDKDTSGALVFARNHRSLRFLQELFRRHAIEREYVALVEGNPPASGTFDAALVRETPGRRRAIAPPGAGGKRAVTHWVSVERWPRAALVSIRLETGRTHQIRLHFAAAGHPVLGDRVYRRSEVAPPVEAPRQMLHARRLGFLHPRSGAPVAAVSPLPDDFTHAIAALRSQKSAPTPSGRSGKTARERPTRRGRR